MNFSLVAGLIVIVAVVLILFPFWRQEGRDRVDVALGYWAPFMIVFWLVLGAVLIYWGMGHAS